MCASMPLFNIISLFCIVDLVNQINLYDNFVDTFDSVKLSEQDNCLNKNKYLISQHLHNFLVNGYKVSRDRTIRKDSEGLYLVVFGNTILKGENTLIYHYIKYPCIFYDTLYSFIKIESSSTVITKDISAGVDYLFIMKHYFENQNDMVKEIWSISEVF